jgi:hypothetical protein
VRFCESCREFGGADPRCHSEGAQVIRQAGLLGSNKIGQGVFRFAVGLFHLLPQGEERGQRARARFVVIKFYIIPDAIRREKSGDCARREQLFVNDLIQQLFCIV